MEKILKRKNPILSSVLSAFVFPGIGQIYNKEHRKGIVLLISYGILLFFTVSPIVAGYIKYLEICANLDTIDISKIDTKFIKRPNIITGKLMTIVWLFAIIDAYISAKKYNKEYEKQEMAAILGGIVKNKMKPQVHTDTHSSHRD